MGYNAAFGVRPQRNEAPPTPIVPLRRVGREPVRTPVQADATAELNRKILATLDQIKVQRESLARETTAALEAIATARQGLVADHYKRSKIRKKAPVRDRRLGDLLKLVAALSEIPVTGLLSQRRDEKVCKTRFVLYWLATRFTDRSYPAIGKAFGGRDHTTIMHGMRRAEALVAVIDPPGSDTPACWARLLLAQPLKAWPAAGLIYDKRGADE